MTDKFSYQALADRLYAPALHDLWGGWGLHPPNFERVSGSKLNRTGRTSAIPYRWGQYPPDTKQSYRVRYAIAIGQAHYRAGIPVAEVARSPEGELQTSTGNRAFFFVNCVIGVLGS